MARRQWLDFYWGIDFEKRIYPNIETFKPVIVSHTWITNPTVTSFMMDSIVARPLNAGAASYMYQVKDNFNCVWDTSVNINVLPPTNGRCASCNTNFPDLKDTSVCLVASLGINLNKSTTDLINKPVVFDAYPNTKLDGNTATLLNPFAVPITVRDIFLKTLTDPLTQIDSVCMDVNSNVADDFIAQIQAPSGQAIFLKPNRVGGVQQPIRSLCFSPTATRAIETAPAPLTGVYKPAAGQTWTTLTGATVNGTWLLLTSIARGGHTDTLTHWSITFKSGNALTYSWTPTNGLSCTTCAKPTAKPVITTQYIVTVLDSLKCTYKDTSRIVVTDSLAAPQLSTGNIKYTSIQFVWNAIPNVTGYEVSLDMGKRD